MFKSSFFWFSLFLSLFGGWGCASESLVKGNGEGKDKSQITENTRRVSKKVNSLVQEKVKKDSARKSSKEEVDLSKKTNSSPRDSLNEEPLETVSIKEEKPAASVSKKNNSGDKQELLREANSPVSPRERRVELPGTDDVVISKNASVSPNVDIVENENGKPGNSASNTLKADMIEDGKTKGDTSVTRESRIPNELPLGKQSLPGKFDRDKLKVAETEIHKEEPGMNLAGSTENKIDVSNTIEGKQIEDLSVKESHGDNFTISPNNNNESNNDIHLRDASPRVREDSGEGNPSVSLSPASPSGGKPNPSSSSSRLGYKDLTPPANLPHSSPSKSSLVLGEVVGSESRVNLNELQKVFSAEQSVDQGRSSEQYSSLAVGFSDLPTAKKRGGLTSNSQIVGFGEKSPLILSASETDTSRSDGSPAGRGNDYGNLRDYFSTGDRDAIQGVRPESRDYKSLKEWADVEADGNKSKFLKETESKKFNRAIEWIRKKGRIEEVE